MLLHLASMKLWHLAQQHVNFDSAVKHIVARVSLEDCANTFKDKDNERFIQASGKKEIIMLPEEWRMKPFND